MIRMLASVAVFLAAADQSYHYATVKPPATGLAVFFGVICLMMAGVFLRGGKPLVHLDKNKPLGHVTWHRWNNGKR